MIGPRPVQAAWIENNERELKKYADEASLFNLNPLLKRAGIAFLAGLPLQECFEAWHQAAVVLQENALLHLHRTAVRRFRTRHIEPLEIALISGNPTLVQQAGATFSMSLHAVMAGMADEEMQAELNTLTNFFRKGGLGGRTHDDGDLAGMGALVFVAALGAMMQGYDDEARAALDLFIKEARRCGVETRASVPDALARYIRLNSILRAWVSPEPEEAMPWLKRLIEIDVERRQAMTLTEDNLGDWLNRSLLALFGLAVLRGQALPEGDIADEGLLRLYEYMSGRDQEEEAEARQKKAKARAEALIKENQAGKDGEEPDEAEHIADPDHDNEELP